MLSSPIILDVIPDPYSIEFVSVVSTPTDVK